MGYHRTITVHLLIQIFRIKMTLSNMKCISPAILLEGHLNLYV